MERRFNGICIFLIGLFLRDLDVDLPSAKHGGGMSTDLDAARRALIVMMLASYLVIAVLVHAVDLRVDYVSMLPLVVVIGATTVVGSAYCSWRKMMTLRDALEPAGIGVLLCVPIALSTYVSASLALPLADDKLSALDGVLGLDWRGFVRAIDASPLLAEALGLAYQSFSIQLLALPVALSILGQAARSYRMICAYALIGLVASLIAIWFPAIGAYRYYAVAPEEMDYINIYFGYFFLEQFNAVRTDDAFVFSLNEAAGIITFPSVHAAVAALCAWAAWPMRWLRYPVLILNIAMAVSAISHGSHYFVDVPAGIFLAVLCIISASGLSRLAGALRLGIRLETGQSDGADYEGKAARQA